MTTTVDDLRHQLRHEMQDSVCSPRRARAPSALMCAAVIIIVAVVVSGCHTRLTRVQERDDPLFQRF